ncbi:MAG: type II toxin-antitoxin system VapC family toxin [Acidobacteriota bacterium]
MGSVSDALGRRVYLDINIIIYAIEGFADYADKIKALLEALDAAEIIAVTSELTLAEVLVKPLKDGNLTIGQVYKDFLSPTPVFDVAPVSREVLESAAECRASVGLKLPDAIHWATFQSRSCDSFLTNDESFRSLQTSGVKILSEIEFK